MDKELESYRDQEALYESVKLFDKLFQLQYACKELQQSYLSKHLSKNTNKMCESIINNKYKNTRMAGLVFADKRFDDYPV